MCKANAEFQVLPIMSRGQSKNWEGRTFAPEQLQDSYVQFGVTCFPSSASECCYFGVREYLYFSAGLAWPSWTFLKRLLSPLELPDSSRLPLFGPFRFRKNTEKTHFELSLRCIVQISGCMFETFVSRCCCQNWNVNLNEFQIITSPLPLSSTH